MATSNDVERARREGELFGIPLGELGWFQTLLISFATGFAAFFLTTFAGIMSLLVYTAATGKRVDFSFAYKRAGLPVGLLVLAVSLGFLGTMWGKRKLRSA